MKWKAVTRKQFYEVCNENDETVIPNLATFQLAKTIADEHNNTVADDPEKPNITNQYWRIVQPEEEDGFPKDAWIYSNDDETVCFIGTDYYGMHFRNAIAALPNLIRALKEIMDWDKHGFISEPIAKRAKDALKKIVGEP